LAKTIKVNFYQSRKEIPVNYINSIEGWQADPCGIKFPSGRAIEMSLRPLPGKMNNASVAALTRVRVVELKDLWFIRRMYQFQPEMRMTFASHAEDTGSTVEPSKRQLM
jgi:hypothetical protein